MDKVRWGILSTAKIAVENVIPAMQQGKYSEIVAIASRNLVKAEKTAQSAGIEKAVGSYEELLDMSDVDAIYNPLPNHLHIPWSIRALRAGKHVLCEKPIALSAEESRKLKEAAESSPELKVMEAFMYRHHPRWTRARELVREEHLGDLKSIHTQFSYFNNEPENIRNKPDMGGGSLMDIGCYGISVARFLFEEEPMRAFGIMEMDPDLQIDRLTSGILQFDGGQATFTCAMQTMRHQSVEVFGTKGRMEIPMPFNPSIKEPTRLHLWTEKGEEVFRFDPCNQYTLQGDLFSKAVLGDHNLPYSLDDSLANMSVIDAIVSSDRKERWVNL